MVVPLNSRCGGTGKFIHAEQYGITDDGVIDYDVLREQALRVKPKVIVRWFLGLFSSC